MKRLIGFELLIFWIFFIISCAVGGSSESSSSKPTAYHINRFLVKNNVWGNPSTPFKQYIFQGSNNIIISAVTNVSPADSTSFIYTNNPGTFIGWDWEYSNNASIAAYPEVFCGHSPWELDTHSAGFPFTAGNHRLTASFNIGNTTLDFDGGNQFDVAFDIWIISNTGNPAIVSNIDIKCEIMVWLDFTNGIPYGITPTNYVAANGSNFGVVITTTSAGTFPHPWTYVAYFLSAGTYFNSTNFDLTPFITYLISSNVINSNDYICTVELGTEVAFGKGRTWISNYSVNILEIK
jgi:hypothetical protein